MNRYILKSYTRSKNTICKAGAAVVSTITSVNKRSPLVLHEEPNAQLIPPHRYLAFINHAG